MSIPYSLLQSCSQWYEYNPSVSEVEKANGLFYMHHTEYSQKMTTRRCISGIDIKIDEEVEFF